MNSIKELRDKSKELGSIFLAAIDYEMRESNETQEALFNKMRLQLNVMKKAIERGNAGVGSHTGLSGYDAQKLNGYINSNKTLVNKTVLKAVRNAMGTNEVNAAMGLICATPTAGSAGVVPGVLMALVEEYELSETKQIEFLFVAAIFGLIIANKASISGAMGGCQAEIGSASAMASAATVYVLGGSIDASCHAMSITIKNMLGLICDPVAGLVEIPCIKRNALGASQALVSADMALAGIKSYIDHDDVILALDAVSKRMSQDFKETALGGLAQTESAKRYESEVLKQP